MSQNHDVHASLQKPIQRYEKLGSFFCEHHVTLAVSELLDVAFVLSTANLVDQELFQPIRSINNEGVKLVRECGQSGDRLSHMFPRFRGRQPGAIQMVRAAFSVEEYGVRKLRREATFPDTFWAIDDSFLWTLDSANANRLDRVIR